MLHAEVINTEEWFQGITMPGVILERTSTAETHSDRATGSEIIDINIQWTMLKLENRSPYRDLALDVHPQEPVSYIP